jgi:hypothetical protein
MASKAQRLSLLRSLILGAACLLAVQAMAGEDVFGLRLSGGYGLSLNSSTEFSSAFNPADSYPLSPGIPTGAEILYSPVRNLDLSLGLFPVFMTRSYTTGFFDAGTGMDVVGHRSDSATFMPVFLSAYLQRPLLGSWELLLGLGAGLVPATAVNSSDDQGQVIQPLNLDAGFAVRALLGLAWSFNPRLRFGLSLQALAFSQHEFFPAFGWSAVTQNYEQVAPQLFAELRL